MYTQCPECGVAFRVTAEVLKQAAGKVRCGGCNVAFNALDHLSEHRPEAPATPQPEAPSQPPELTPEQAGKLEAGTPPKSISAEQSAALLKTLDQLAGPDIRIEDTGVEWRVLGDDEDDEGDATDDEVLDEAKAAIALEDSFKPIDEVITESASEDAPPEVVEEMRFDDNTPLPEDFDFEAAALTTPVAEATGPAPAADPADAQVDLAFGDPEEWQDLLGDIEAPAVAEVEEAEAFVDEEQPATEEPAIAEDLDKVVPAAAVEAATEVVRDEPLDMDTQFAIQAEAMGIDLSGLHETRKGEDAEDEPESAPLDVDRSETTIEEDLIAAAFEAEAAQDEIAAESSIELQALDQELGLEDAGDLTLLDSGEPGLAETDAETGRELEEADAGGDEVEETDAEPERELEEADAGHEVEKTDADPELELEEADAEFELELKEADEALATIDIDFDASLEPEEEVERKADVDDIASRFDDQVEDLIETMAGPPDTNADTSPPDAADEHVVPEMSEEEMTINMLIDQDLLNIAVEDEEGFASTIVQLQPDKKVEQEVGANKEKKKKKDKKKDLKKEERPPLVETIIMEGDSILAESAGEEEPRKQEKPAFSLPLHKTPDDYMRSRQDARPRWGVIGGIVALLVLLGLQVVHQSREALATVPVFNKAVGPVYRMIGKPLTPTWDISGWRFEATKGSTDENDELLTIYSRVGNESDKALPYPLVHVSLTDRFEEIIGSRVLEPGEYLPENTDPRKLVPPGNTFNAVISIASPDAEATGFKLNVCYRLANGQLRCEIEDFK